MHGRMLMVRAGLQRTAEDCGGASNQLSHELSLLPHAVHSAQVGCPCIPVSCLGRKVWEYVVLVALLGVVPAFIKGGC